MIEPDKRRGMPGYIADHHVKLLALIEVEMTAAGVMISESDRAAMVGFVSLLDALRGWRTRFAQGNGFSVGRSMAAAYSVSAQLGLSRDALNRLINEATRLHIDHYKGGAHA